MAPTRECVACGQRKTVNGVWALMAGATGDGRFVCGSCAGVEGPAELPVRAT